MSEFKRYNLYCGDGTFMIESDTGHYAKAADLAATIAERDAAMAVFVDLVERMRTAQRNYFRNRDSENLIAAKNFEKRVDQSIKDIKETLHGTRD